MAIFVNGKLVDRDDIIRVSNSIYKISRDIGSTYNVDVRSLSPRVNSLSPYYKKLEPLQSTPIQESAYEYMEKYKHYMKTPNKEEYYCDLFAGMYNLPLTFTEGYKKRDFTANQIKEEQLQRLTDLEGKIFNLQLIYYPTMAERNHAGYTVAKTILDSKNKIAPEYKEYCKWVVANYSNMEKTDIKTNFRSQNFDPREAEDLDRHVQNIIDNNNITMTEFAV
jgi:hypothetical protein